MLPPQVNPARLPNFGAITQHLRGVTMELDYCDNLGPVQRANELAALQASMNTLTANVTNLTTTVTNLTTTVETIRAEIRTTKTELEQKITNEVQAAKADLETQITNTKTELETQITNTKTELEAKITSEVRAAKVDLETQLQAMKDSIGLTIDDCEFNSKARAANKKMAGVGAGELRPLRNITTHEEIRIPATVVALGKLTANDIDGILVGLGQELVEGERKSERLAKLRQFIGVEIPK
ncbi:hypothetical protein F4679DRAFT_556583 [Xylaria curta]|nr:hypothetical protein F4679DRAFT_556583 [Xylaria curta]